MNGNVEKYRRGGEWWDGFKIMSGSVALERGYEGEV